MAKSTSPAARSFLNCWRRGYAACALRRNCGSYTGREMKRRTLFAAPAAVLAARSNARGHARRTADERIARILEAPRRGPHRGLACPVVRGDTGQRPRTCQGVLREVRDQPRRRRAAAPAPAPISAVPLRKLATANLVGKTVPVTASDPFKWRHYPGEAILLVRALVPALSALVRRCAGDGAGAGNISSQPTRVGAWMRRT